jgi:hypothetical protein
MHRLKRTVWNGGPVLLALLTGALGVWPRDAAAVAYPVYEVSVPLDGTAAEDRAAAFSEALRTVAVRATGRVDAASSRAVASADPTRYVQRYSTTAEKTLRVGFDPDAVAGLLAAAGLPVWPQERPIIRVSAAGVDRAEIERAAEWRGLPIEWGSPLAVAGADAGSPGIAWLAGAANGGQTRWTFTYEGQSVAAAGGAAQGIDLAADALAEMYAPASTRSVNVVQLDVHGLNGITDYAGLISYLQTLSPVHDLEVEALAGDSVRLRVSVRGDVRLLARLFALDSRLRPVMPGERDTAGEAEFYYVP